MIESTCPECGHTFSADVQDAASKVICDHCNHVFHTYSTAVLETVGPPVPHQPAEPTFAPLGYGRWIVIFLLPPAGLLLSFLVPFRHPEKIRAIATSLSMMAVGASLFVLINFWITEQFLDLDLGWEESEPELEYTFADETLEVLLAGADETILARVKVPELSGVEFERTTPYGLSHGPFAHEDISGLAFFTGIADDDFEEITFQYRRSLVDSGWIIEAEDNTSRGNAPTTNFTGTFKGKKVFLQITESDDLVKITFITRHE